MPRTKPPKAAPKSTAALGFEAKLWAAADAMRNNMDAAEYKHVVLGQIINLVSDIALGSAADKSKDTLGRVYEYFLSRFASAEGKSGGQFYTPSHVVRVLVEMLAPYKGRVYPPDMQEKATQLVLEQAEVLCGDWPYEQSR
jgi:type I restriction-modification system DNA methylase subunit